MTSFVCSDFFSRVHVNLNFPSISSPLFRVPYSLFFYFQIEHKTWLCWKMSFRFETERNCVLSIKAKGKLSVRSHSFSSNGNLFLWTYDKRLFMGFTEKNSAISWREGGGFGWGGVWIGRRGAVENSAVYFLSHVTLLPM